MRLIYFTKLLIKSLILLAIFALFYSIFVIKHHSIVNDVVVDPLKQLSLQNPEIIENVKNANSNYQRTNSDYTNKDTHITSYTDIVIDSEFLNSLFATLKNSKNSSHFSVKENNNESEWTDYGVNAKYHAKFWELVKAKTVQTNTTTLGNGPSDANLVQQSLWRPPLNGMGMVSNLSLSNRIVPQLVWQIEAGINFTQGLNPHLKRKTIVLWEGFAWWNKHGWNATHILDSSECEISPNSLAFCQFVENSKELDLEKVDAVVATRDQFHYKEYVTVPPHVLKFYSILESPFHSWALLNRTNDLLASYWRGSDIVTPYAKWVYYDLNIKTKKSDIDYAKGKSKVAAAFISNCQPWNNRLGFVTELQKHMSVHVYGACGTHNCSKESTNDCFSLLKNDYYFYIAFENTNCRDYITEKFFVNALENNVVPIVMGAHPEDYLASAPYKSYIHVEDFESPKALAEYLNYLTKNPIEYNKYFEWKGTGEFISSSFFCQLCAMVHYSDKVQPPVREEPFVWGYAQSTQSKMCLPKNQWYWDREIKS